jgi:hypothetical protein
LKWITSESCEIYNLELKQSKKLKNSGIVPLCITLPLGILYKC